ncbi:MAG: alkaline phosphatase [Anaeromyxobacteraceae bacterium]
MHALQRILTRAAALAALFLAPPARGAPTEVALVPPSGARFLEGQRFDIRVEGRGTGPYTAALSVDGVPVAYSSGAQDTAETDGITQAGFGGFNRRAFSFAQPGVHVLAATFSDASGAATVTSTVEVVPVSDRGARNGRKPEAKNVIIMLGDGMGVAHRTAARIVEFGVTGGQPNGWLAMDRFPGVGLVSTHSLNSLITDSSPGMACYSTGNHANNNQEGVYPARVVDPFLQPRVEYMSEYLHRVRGTSLGLVSTADVEDATPAANAVHTGNRNAGTGIVDQYFDERSSTGLAVLMGSGRRWFVPASDALSSRSAATDYPALPRDLVEGWGIAASGGKDPGRDLLADFVADGYAYADSASALGATLARSPSRLLGLFGHGNMNVALDKLAKRRNALLPGATTFAVDDYRAPDQPMLDEMTDAALRVLARNRNGFVLMVEGAHIDKQSHAMDAERVIDEVIEFDRAVAVARSFAERAGDTVVVVLADHECSGFSLVGALASVQAARALPSDAAVLDPLAQPGRQKLVTGAGFPRYVIAADGYPESLEVDGKVLVGYGANGDRYETWLQKPLPVIDSLLPGALASDLAGRGYPAEPVTRAESQSGMFIRGQAAGRAQAAHTAADIPLSVFSSGSDVWRDFVGVQTNTDVFFKLMRAALTTQPHGP